MAVDTAAKRWSALSIGDLFAILPPEDGIVGAGDRHTLLGLYGGDATPSFNEFIRTRTRRDPQFSGKRERP